MQLAQLLIVAILATATWVGPAAAQVPQPFARPMLSAAAIPQPGPRDLCPVCGMLVSKYPLWVATILYQDGRAYHFDGAKDMFKFWFEPEKYVANRGRDQIASIWVTEYYDLRRIDAKTAFYVVGSGVLGPMGHEFIPLASLADAEAFLKEHRGKRILRFGEVTRELPLRLDKGRF